MKKVLGTLLILAVVGILIGVMANLTSALFKETPN